MLEPSYKLNRILLLRHNNKWEVELKKEKGDLLYFNGYREKFEKTESEPSLEEYDSAMVFIYE